MTDLKEEKKPTYCDNIPEEVAQVLLNPQST